MDCKSIIRGFESHRRLSLSQKPCFSAWEAVFQAAREYSELRATTLRIGFHGCSRVRRPAVRPAAGCLSSVHCQSSHSDSEKPLVGHFCHSPRQRPRTMGRSRKKPPPTHSILNAALSSAIVSADIEETSPIARELITASAVASSTSSRSNASSTVLPVTRTPSFSRMATG